MEKFCGIKERNQLQENELNHSCDKKLEICPLQSHQAGKQTNITFGKDTYVFLKKNLDTLARNTIFVGESLP